VYLPQGICKRQEGHQVRLKNVATDEQKFAIELVGKNTSYGTNNDPVKQFQSNRQGHIPGRSRQLVNRQGKGYI